MRLLRGCGVLLMFYPGLVLAAGDSHTDPITSVILTVTILLFCALLGRYIAQLLNQPAVLGELLMGVLIGNLLYFVGSDLMIVLREGSAIYNITKEVLAGLSLNQSIVAVISNSFYAQQMTQALSGPEGAEYLKIAYIVDIFSRYGIIFLLFVVGLESSIAELKRTGFASLKVAVIGVIAPMILGFGMTYFIMPHSSFQADLFIAATLSATSIGITARVLIDLKQLNTREAQTILGAAILDDLFGLIILAIVSSIVINGTVNIGLIAQISCAAIVFFIMCLVLGPYILKTLIRFSYFMKDWEAKLFISFFMIMALSWIAVQVQLAAIIGAFTAGIILKDHYFKNSDSMNTTIKQVIAPLEAILAPLFFIVIGIQVKLETFFSLSVIILGTGLVIAAIIGKLASGIGANRQDDCLFVGIGMIPRGEVGLVFASIGKTLGVIDDNLFSAIVFMILVTTFITPWLLKMRYKSRYKELNR